LKAVSTAGQKLTKAMRLHQRGVALVLKQGRMVRADCPSKTVEPNKRLSAVSIKYLSATTDISYQCGSIAHARIAISVPKRLLKSAVDRNQFKRWVRESFRRHEIRALPVDMLISLTQRVDATEMGSGGSIQRVIESAFNLVHALSNQSTDSSR